MSPPFELAVDPKLAHLIHVSFDMGDLPVVFRTGAFVGVGTPTTRGIDAKECCPIIVVSLMDGGAFIQSGYQDHTPIPNPFDAFLRFEEVERVDTIEDALRHPGILERIEHLQCLGDPVAYMERLEAEYDAYMSTMPDAFDSDQAYYDWCEGLGLEPSPLHTFGSYVRTSVRGVQDARRAASEMGAYERSHQARDDEYETERQMRLNAHPTGDARYRLGSDEPRVTLHGTGSEPWALFDQVRFAEGTYRVVGWEPITIADEHVRRFGGSFVGHEGEPGWIITVERLEPS